MDYFTYFGDCEKQIDNIETIEKELFIRKVVSLGMFSEILKERGISLYLETDEVNKEISLNIEKNDCAELYGCNQLSFLLIRSEQYGLEHTFFDRYITLMNCAMEINEKLKYEDIRKLKLPKKIKVEASSDEWIRTIFKVLNHAELYRMFMSQILNSELDINNKKEKAWKV